MASSSVAQNDLDVFISFRGEDTRYGFVSHLYEALYLKDINAFIDEDLSKGDRIEKLFEVIERSRIFIVVYSKNYASSHWCLREVAKIMECAKKDTTMPRYVLPIFYKVDPFEARRQRGVTGDHLQKHEMKYGKDSIEVASWRAALKEFGSISGWHFTFGPESGLVNEVIKRVMSILEGRPQVSLEKNSLLRGASAPSTTPTPTANATSSKFDGEAATEMLDSMRVNALNNMMTLHFEQLDLIENYKNNILEILNRNNFVYSPPKTD